MAKTGKKRSNPTPASYKKPPTAAAAVLVELRRRIIVGELHPGDQILADAIGEDLEVSRIPVREALRVLEGEGQVSYQPHRGYFVAELTMSDLTELYHIRELLERDALSTTVPKLGETEFEEMERALEELDAASEVIDVVGCVRANREFHLAFLEPLQFPRQRRQIEVLYDQCDPYGSIYHTVAANRKMSQKDHLAMLAAGRSHDYKHLVKVLSDHRRHVIEVLAKVLMSDPDHSAQNEVVA